MALFGTSTPKPAQVNYGLLGKPATPTTKAPVSCLIGVMPANPSILAPVINKPISTSGTVAGLLSQSNPTQANTATQGASSATPAPAPAQAPAVTWNKDVATSVGQLLGLLQPGQVATGGFLDAKVASASPEVQAEYRKIANGIQQGTMTQDDLVNHFIERQATMGQKDPTYGSLAKAPYEKFTPYSGATPEFKPFAMSDFMASPDYQFRLEEGQKAIDRAGAARGNFYSGGALKEAARFGSNLASGEFNQARNNYNQDFQTKYGMNTDAYNRYNTNFGLGYGQAKSDSDTLYNRFAGMAGAGSGTANAAVANNTNNANATGNIYGQVANSVANSQIAGANNLSQILANTFGRSSYGK